ncbi:MAG: phosphoglycerate dehydrogenase, partial [Chloroflexi bacterium]|nr:phosphoglycerate dehydrogenase [Chloroflexota bacterium]
RLRVIGNHGVGLDPVDLGHARRLGIPVVNTPHANTMAVAEHAAALVLGLAKRLGDGWRSTACSGKDAAAEL